MPWKRTAIAARVSVAHDQLEGQERGDRDGGRAQLPCLGGSSAAIGTRTIRSSPPPPGSLSGDVAVGVGVAVAVGAGVALAVGVGVAAGSPPPPQAANTHVEVTTAIKCEM